MTAIVMTLPRAQLKGWRFAKLPSRHELWDRYGLFAVCLCFSAAAHYALLKAYEFGFNNFIQTLSH